MDPLPDYCLTSETMDRVICLKGPTYTFVYCFKDGSLETEFDFCECSGFSNQGKFTLKGAPGGTDNLELCVLRSGDITGYYSVEVKVRSGDQEDNVTFVTESKFWKPLLEDEFDRNDPIEFTVEFKFSDRKTWVDDMKAFLNEYQLVTMIGSDGQVTVSKLLLEIRSPAFKAMLGSDMEESKSLRVDLSKDFNSATLNAFKNFLTTDIIHEDFSTEVTGLYRLGDKYLMESLKQAAKYRIMKEIKSFDHDKMFDVLIQADEGFVNDQFLHVISTSGEEDMDEEQ